MSDFLDSGVLPIASRITAGFVGGYCFVLGVTTLGIALGIHFGMPYAEVMTLMYLLAFLIYTAVFCWAFIHRSLVNVWLLLLGGGLAMTTIGWWLGNHV